MSWMDSASGSSSYGVGGNLGNTGAGTGGTTSNGTSSGGGNKTGNYGNTGLTTGKTIYGNTAFGPAGGAALGYAMASNGGKANIFGPSVQKYSNFKTPSGKQAFAGNPSIKSTSGARAYNTLAAQQQQNQRTKPAAGKGMVGTPAFTQKPKMKIYPPNRPPKAPYDPNMAVQTAPLPRLGKQITDRVPYSPNADQMTVRPGGTGLFKGNDKNTPTYQPNGGAYAKGGSVKGAPKAMAKPIAKRAAAPKSSVPAFAKASTPFSGGSPHFKAHGMKRGK